MEGGGVAEGIAAAGGESEGDVHITTLSPRQEPNSPAVRIPNPGKRREARFRFIRARHRTVCARPGSSAALPYALGMMEVQTVSRFGRTWLSPLAGLAMCLQPPLVAAQNLRDGQPVKIMTVERQTQAFPFDQRAGIIYDSYILGPGDRLRIELLDLPELSGEFKIGPDGTLYLPRVRGLQVEGLTIEELRLFLTDQFRTYVQRPEVFIKPIGYRPVRVYVGGEVARPGYYTIRGAQLLKDLTFDSRYTDGNSGAVRASHSSLSSLNPSASSRGQLEELSTPTLFDALQAARGVTPFSQLETVKITRKRPLSKGGGKIQTKVNFLRLISDGDEAVNIRLYDGDAVFVSKSKVVLRDQLMAASRTNLSPDFIEVFVSGRVKEPGPQQLPQGASLNQAIASAGGTKFFRGSVEFLRFTQDGATDRRIFGYSPKSISGDYRNPVLMPGDVVRVNDSLVSASLEVLNEITAPAVGLYSVYSIFGD